MKWYNQRAYKQHIEDLKHLDVADWRKKLCLEFVNSVASTFNRSYPRIGILDINDLVQEGHLAALTSWRRLDWEAIKNAPEDEWQPIIWNYVRLGISSGIKRAIAKNRDTIRIPEHYYTVDKVNGSNTKKAFETDIFLTRTFTSFFQDYAETIEYQGESYENEQLNDFLHDVMDDFLDGITKQVIMMVYGMDESNDIGKSFNHVSEWLKKPPATIRKIKQRGIAKLQKEEAQEQIEKYLLYRVTN